jgi:hypothetical protein
MTFKRKILVKNMTFSHLPGHVVHVVAGHLVDVEDVIHLPHLFDVYAVSHKAVDRVLLDQDGLLNATNLKKCIKRLK